MSKENSKTKKREQLELLLDCRKYELLICQPDTWMYGEIQKDIKYLQKRLSKLNAATQVDKPTL